MVRRLRPDLRIALLRGNVETRLAKVARGEAAATLLALAGLKRLGLEAAATAVLDVREFVPAAGQGAIAITMRTGDTAIKAFLGAGSRRCDGHSACGGARLSAGSRWLLQNADRRIRVRRSG
jgi:porphobilinogen deaminase